MKNSILRMTLFSLMSLVSLQMVRAGVQFAYSDHLGSTGIETNEEGEAQQIECYFPFGELSDEIRNTKDASPFLYTGQELDRASDLYYYGARYYDPALSRFASTDPVFDGPNPYAYVQNNPILYADPTGNIIEGKDIEQYASELPVWNEGGNIELIFVDTSGLKMTNEHLNTGLGDRLAKASKNKVSLVESQFGVTFLHPHGAGTDEWYAIVPSELADKVKSAFDTFADINGKKISLWSVNSADVTGKSLAQLYGIYNALQKRGVAHSILAALQGKYTKRTAKQLEGVEDPDAIMRIIAINREGSRAAKRAAYETLMKNGTRLARGAGKFIPGVGIACGLQCLAEGDALGATLNFMGELPPPFGPTADVLSMMRGVEGDPSYRSPYLTEDRCVRNACHMGSK